MRTESLTDRLVKASHGQMLGATLVVLRVVIGLEFFLAGVGKLGGWSAAGYLQAANGPLAAWFQSLAGNGVIDALNVWGLILIGAALILGLLVRPASMFGVLMMALYYLAHFVDNTKSGLVDGHIVNIAVFLVMIAGGAGHIFGLNGLLANTLRKPKAVTRFLIG